MSTSSTKQALEGGKTLAHAPETSRTAERPEAWPGPSTRPANDPVEKRRARPAGGDALQALLAFSALHQQIRQRRAFASRAKNFDGIAPTTAPEPDEFEATEQFVLDEVLQSAAERAVAITGADGLGIALAENNEIVLRASAGTIKPDVGARIQRDSAFSGACFRSAQIIRCDDSETDARVNVQACRDLGARSMVAVPLCGRRRVIGLLEAFSAEPFGFNDSDVSSLELLAELIVSALKPEEEDRFAQSAQVAEKQLIEPECAVPAVTPVESVPAIPVPQASPIPAAISPAEIFSVAAPETSAATAISEAEKTPTPEVESLVEVAPSTEADTELAPEAATEPQSRSHRGILIAFVILVLFALAALGWWWRTKNAQMAAALLPATLPGVQQPAANSSTPKSAAPVPLPPSGMQPPADANVESSSTSAADAATAAETDVDSAPAGGAPSEATGKAVRMTGVRHWSSADSSTVVLDLQDQVQYEAHRLSNPDRIYFDLHGTALASQIAQGAIDIGDPLLARVRLAQPVAGSVRVVLETKGTPTYSVSLETNPYRLVVQLRKPGASPTSQIDLFPGNEAQKKKVAINVPPPTREDLQLKAHLPKMRIVVDAGHGGWDLGTVGKHGLLEKDVVLEIAQRLGKLLESRLGAEVILTRNDDTYIPLDERAGVANQAQADLFVSVHANYSDLPSARGVETYYTNFFSAPAAKDIETRQVSTGKSNSAVALSPADLHDRIEQSRKLAASVQRSLYGGLSTKNPGLRDRGVKEASYVVLTETAMPGILAEVSFVSSPADEQRLRTDGYREQIAEALYKGIAKYAASSRPVKIASAAK